PAIVAEGGDRDPAIVTGGAVDAVGRTGRLLGRGAARGRRATVYRAIGQERAELARHGRLLRQVDAESLARSPPVPERGEDRTGAEVAGGEIRVGVAESHRRSPGLRHQEGVACERLARRTVAHLVAGRPAAPAR